MKYLLMVTKPVKSFWDGCTSMLSETGKQSLKRGISAEFGVLVAFIVYHVVMGDTMSKEKYDVIKFLTVGLWLMIALLTGVATVKDIIAFKNGNKVEELKSDVPVNGANANDVK